MLSNATGALIAALGGISCVAEYFDLTTQAVSAWIAEDDIPRSREAAMLQLVVKAEAETGRVILWRPRGWDRCIELRYNPGVMLAAD